MVKRSFHIWTRRDFAALEEWLGNTKTPAYIVRDADDSKPGEVVMWDEDWFEWKARDLAEGEARASEGEGERRRVDVLGDISDKLTAAGVERDGIAHLVESLCEGVDENTQEIQAGFKAAEKMRLAAEIRRAPGNKNVLDKLDTLSANVQKVNAGLKEMQEFWGKMCGEAEVTGCIAKGRPVPDTPVASTTLQRIWYDPATEEVTLMLRPWEYERFVRRWPPGALLESHKVWGGMHRLEMKWAGLMFALRASEEATDNG